MQIKFFRTLFIAFIVLAQFAPLKAADRLISKKAPDFLPCMVLNGTIGGTPNSSAVFPNPIVQGTTITIIAQSSVTNVEFLSLDGTSQGNYSPTGTVSFPEQQILDNGWFDKKTIPSLVYTGFVIPKLPAGSYLVKVNTSDGGSVVLGLMDTEPI